MTGLTPQKMMLSVKLGCLLLLLLSLPGCAVKMVSSYDQQTDLAVTELHQQLSWFFVQMQAQHGLPECEYRQHLPFYQQVTVSLDSLALRVNAIADNDLTIAQVALLQDSLQALQQLHQLGCFSPEQLNSLRSSFDSSFTAILKLELAKQRVR